MRPWPLTLPWKLPQLRDEQPAARGEYERDYERDYERGYERDDRDY